MRNPVADQTGQVADGHSATSAQLRHATADLIPTRHSSLWPRPEAQAFAVRTNGAPQQGLLFAAFSVRFQNPKTVARKPSPKLRKSQ
jgi:hypothetical protein